jgi:spore maturation protein CgeB
VRGRERLLGEVLKIKLRIGLRLPAIGTLNTAGRSNMQGDEQVARAWEKYLARCESVESVRLYGGKSPIHEELDVLIHFSPFLELHEKTKNVLYLQNAFPESVYRDGTVGVFRQTRNRFSGFIFTSRNLMKACTDGAVVPFATDPDVFFPQNTESYRLPVAFVGNDIRGAAINHRYLFPAIPLGLVIYGNHWAPPLDRHCRGKLPMGDLPKLYSSAMINLNAHIPEHVRWGTINLRIFDILASGGFVVSDHTDALHEEFDDAVVSTDGYDDLWAKIVRYLADPEERRRRSSNGRKIVLSNHTYANRVGELIAYLKALV